MKILKWLDTHFEEVLLGIFLLLITAVIFLQIIFRYCLKASLIWPEEFARFCLVCSTIFSMGYCIRRNTMMKVDIVANLLPAGLRRVVDLGIVLLSIALYAFLFYYSIDVTKTAAKTHQLSTAMLMPMSWLYGVCTAALALAVVREIQRLVLSLREGGARK